MDYDNNENVKQGGGFKEKLQKNIFGIEDDLYEEVYEEDDYVEESRPRKMFGRSYGKKNNNNSNGGGMKVCVIKPTSIEDGREIASTLLENRTVLLNMEGLDLAVAQRVIDFSSGACYAINGNLQKISNHIFLLTPASVDVSGDFSEIMGGSIDMPY